MKSWLALDQWGNKEILKGNFPRKLLLERNCRKHAEKVYRDYKDKPAVHVGYVVAGHWYDVYELVPLSESK